MNNISKIAGVAVALVFLCASPVMAKKPENKGNGQGHQSEHSDHGAKGNDGRQEMHYAGISQRDAERYARQYQFYGYKPLPPGIRKNMARGKPIPPGLAYQRLPPAYVNSLPRYSGYEWRGYGSDLVLVSIVSNVIADVIIDALH